MSQPLVVQYILWSALVLASSMRRFPGQPDGKQDQKASPHNGTGCQDQKPNEQRTLLDLPKQQPDESIIKDRSTVVLLLL